MVVFSLWLSALVATVVSLGLPALISPLAAFSVSEGSSGTKRRLGLWCATHVLGAAVAGAAVGVLGPGPMDAGGQSAITMAAMSAAVAAQASGNSLFGGLLRNDLVLSMNATVAASLLVLMLLFGSQTPADAVAVVAAGQASRVLVLTAVSVAVLRSSTQDLSPSANFFAQPWGWAFALTLLGAIGFQRLEALFLERRSTASELAAFGVAFDASQVVRGTATAAFAVLIPLFVIELAKDREATLMMAGSLAVVTAAVIACTSIVCLLAARVLGLEGRLMGSVQVGAVAGVLVSTAASAGANVLGQLLLADRRFRASTFVMGSSAFIAVILNIFVTQSVATAGLVQVLMSSWFLFATVLSVGQGFRENGFMSCAATIGAIVAAAYTTTSIRPSLSVSVLLAVTSIAIIWACSRSALRVLMNGLRR